MKKEKLLIIPLILVLVFWAVLLYNFLGGKKAPQPITPPVGEKPTLNPTKAVIKEKTDKVLQEGGVIPFDYEVLSVSAGSAVLKGEMGNLTLLNHPSVKVFFKKNEVVTPASFEDLKIGQKLVLEFAAPPSEETKAFIVRE